MTDRKNLKINTSAIDLTVNNPNISMNDSGYMKVDKNAVRFMDGSFSVVINDLPDEVEQEQYKQKLAGMVNMSQKLRLEVEYRESKVNFEIDSLGMLGSERRGCGNVVFGNQYAKSVFR